MATVTRLTPPTLPEVTGYVEAATADRLLGWAWAPGTPSIRAMIELRLGDEIVARAVADQPRPDLASNGVGDGRHAFEIAVPNDYRARIAELRVFARSGDGEALPIGAPPAAEGLSEQIAKLARGVDALVASQRLMHRNLQAALSSRSHGPAESEEQMTTLARMAEAQTALGEQLATVERFMVRLDEHLAGGIGTKASGARGLAKTNATAFWALALSGTALLVAIAELARSLAG